MGQGQSAEEGAWPASWFNGDNTGTQAQLEAIKSVAAKDPSSFTAQARAGRAELMPELWPGEFPRFKALSAAHAANSPDIANLVYKLVPKHCTESEFWRCYWCHVYAVLEENGLEPKGIFDLDVLRRQDDVTSNAVIGMFSSFEAFATLSRKETEAIVKRDAEDDEKLAAGIRIAVDRGVVEAEPPLEPVKKIDVLGKSADQVAKILIDELGEAAQTGCVVVLQGLSGTGKGTTVDRVKKALPNAVTWSNGNVFRCLTLLTIAKCKELGMQANEDGACSKAPPRACPGAGGLTDLPAPLTPPKTRQVRCWHRPHAGQSAGFRGHARLWKAQWKLGHRGQRPRH